MLLLINVRDPLLDPESEDDLQSQRDPLVYRGERKEYEFNGKQDARQSDLRQSDNFNTKYKQSEIEALNNWLTTVLDDDVKQNGITKDTYDTALVALNKITIDRYLVNYYKRVLDSLHTLSPSKRFDRFPIYTLNTDGRQIPFAIWNKQTKDWVMAAD